MKSREEYKQNFLNKAKAKHGDRYNYSHIEYVTSSTKIMIQCNIHGFFLQTPDGHIYSSGCKQCALQKAHEERKNSTSDFIQKSRKIHGDKYNYDKVEYYNAKTKVEIICKKEGHSSFYQRADRHISGQGCPTCGLELSKKAANKPRNNKYTKEMFVQNCIKIHGDKYDYSLVDYKNSTTKVIIICKEEHGEFLQRPHDHLNSTGCRKCAIKSNALQKSGNTEEFIKKGREKYGNKYDYSKVEYINHKTNVIIICPIHDQFTQKPAVHLVETSHGCPKCSIDYISNNRRLDTDKFIKKAINVHGKNKYDYLKVDYVDSVTKITITCKKHGDFFQSPSIHLRGGNCPKCYLCPKCQLWRTFNKLCDYCKPKNNNKLYQKTKEMEVVKYLKEKLLDNEFIHNKSVGKDCTEGHLFPDILFDCDYYNLIIEIDEHKHRGADYKCDKQRMYDIIAKLGMPCIFIRYNPDSKDSNKEVLLNTVKQYLNLKNKKIWDDYGFKVDYLFY